VTKRVLIYTRVSTTADAQAASPDRQETLCRNLARDRGWEVVGTHTDRGASAWKRGAKRPGWDAAMRAVRRRECDVLMGYSLTRLGRRARDLLDLSDTLQAHDVALVVVDQQIDTTTPAGTVLFTLIAALAEMESATTSERVRSAQGLAAQRGQMHTGGRRAWGYSRDGTVDAAEAKLIREAARDITAGKSVRQVAADLNAAGSRTTTGREWTAGGLAQSLRSPRLAGLRTHNGRLLPGSWRPVLSQEAWTDMRAAMGGRGRGGGISTPRHLLSGLLSCSRCGHSMVSHFSKATETRGAMDRYQCNRQPGSGACGRMAVSKSGADQFVVDQFFDFMSRVKLSPTEQGAERSLAEIEADLAETEAAMATLSRRQYVTLDPKLPDDVFSATINELTTKLAALQRAQEQAADEVVLRSTALRPGSREDIEAWWDLATLAERRQALARAISKVTVRPATSRGNRFDPSRVHIGWSFAIYKEAVRQRFGATPAQADAVDAAFREKAKRAAREAERLGLA
jgi:site-specific DNA recombinase